MKSWNLNRKYLILFKSGPGPAEKSKAPAILRLRMMVTGIGYCLELTDKTKNIHNKNR